MRKLALSRDDLSHHFTGAMSGLSSAGDNAPLGASTGRVKTVAVEVNLPEESAAGALARAQGLAESVGLRFLALQDEALAMLQGDKGTLIVDMLDPRFWLVHTSARVEFLDQVLKTSLWSSRDLDWCWLPKHIVEDFRTSGAVQWFKTDFQSDQLTPVEGQKARRLRVQLEGDDAYELLQVIQGQPDYTHAAPLTAIAVELSDSEIGEVREVADYKGRFAATGNSFDLHVGWVSRVIGLYSRFVRGLEADFAIKWSQQEDGGLTFDGEVVTMNFGRRVSDLDTFLSGLFSCRDPFRLWGVPRVSDGFASVRAVDLHVGKLLDLEIHQSGMRIYLREGGCGNSVARLLANLQHRYDATIHSPTAARVN